MSELTDKEKKALANWDKGNEGLVKSEAYFDVYKSQVICAIERNYHKEIIKFWQITDILPKGDKYLLCWKKRMFPLDDEGLEKIFGKEE